MPHEAGLGSLQLLQGAEEDVLASRLPCHEHLERSLLMVFGALGATQGSQGGAPPHERYSQVVGPHW